MKTVLKLLLVTVLCGCGPRADRVGLTAMSDGPLITVVGDATASMVVEKLGENGLRTSSILDDQADSSLVIVVQNSTVGPLPVHSEIAKTLAKRPGHEYLWVFTNTSLVEDQELLELEELECRDIFNGVGLPSDDVPFAFDSDDAPVSTEYECPKGWNAIIRHIRSIVD